MLAVALSVRASGSPLGLQAFYMQVLQCGLTSVKIFCTSMQEGFNIFVLAENEMKQRRFQMFMKNPWMETAS